MKDYVPSILTQGLAVRRLRSRTRTYNSGMLVDGKRTLLLSRQWNPQTGHTALLWQEAKGDRLTARHKLEFGGEGFEDYEDARVIAHAGQRYIAYTDADYRGEQFTSRQGFAQLTAGLDVAQTYRIAYGNNYRGGGPHHSEKNWAFFSHEGRLHLVYSIGDLRAGERHVVAALDERMQPAQDWRTEGVMWPWGSPSGGTPPVRVGDRYIAFFHSFTTRHMRRRYNMAAYAFEAKPPFHILAMSEPLLRASDEDESTVNPANPRWRPLVVFPMNALRQGAGWLVATGVNDSYDVLVSIKDEQIRWHSASDWAKPWPRYFEAENGTLPVDYNTRTKPAHMAWQKWTPVGIAHAGQVRGVMASTDCNLTEALEALAAEGKGIREIQAADYQRAVGRN
jgi:predicted GH43/DUF377 family glycosyl hydrolase